MNDIETGAVKEVEKEAVGVEGEVAGVEKVKVRGGVEVGLIGSALWLFLS